MEVIRNADGTLTVPMRAEAHGIIGDALVTIGPGHPDYEAWDSWVRQHGESNDA